MVTHVQDVLQPDNRLPEFNPRTSIVLDELGALRREPPDWLSGGDPNEPQWDGEDEIALPPDETAIDPADVTNVSMDPDVHAFYLPFHFYKHRWGIYIRAKSVVTLTAHLLKRNVLTGGPTEQAVARSVFRMLLEHETFHHLTELAISRLELVALEYMRGDSLYGQNFSVKDSIDLEEGLANVYALRELGRSVQPMRYTIRSTVLALISRFMERQPAGYRDFEQYLGDAAFRTGQDDIITEAKVLSPLLGRRGGEDGVLPGRAHYVEKRRPEFCPVRVVFEKGVPLSRLKPFPIANGMRVLVHTRNEHPPPHFHLFMPPDREYGRYGWPGLESVGGAPPLSRKETETLRSYIRGCQPQIYQKVRSVYADVPNIE
jgi:hypothetical protein